MSGKFQWCFKGVSRKFQRSRNFQESFKKVSTVLQASFKCVSRKIEGCFKGVLSGFHVGFKLVSWIFERSSKAISVYNFTGLQEKGVTD